MVVPIKKLGSALLLSAAVLFATSAGAKETTKRKPTAGKTNQHAASPVAKPVAVNDLAANPSRYLGRVAVVGTVGTSQPGKGFLLIDTREYKACGLTCLTDSGTKKVPVRWSGTAPKPKNAVRVTGTLTKTAQGLSFTADKVERA